MINIEGKEYYSKDYFDKDYFETAGYKSGYSKSSMNRDSYLNKAIAVWIVQTLKLGGSERILEIGCAFGWVIEHLIELYNLDAYGQDISTYSILNAPDNIKNRIKECSNTNIVFDGKFDVVYSLETFEHIPKPLVDEYFANIYNCINDNGILLCTICLGHNDNRGTDIDQSHQTLQPREWWNTKLEEAGFIIRKDLEAEAYELGLQTAEMPVGQWLPRTYNWHVFVAEKQKPTTLQATQYNIVSNEKFNLLIVGDRAGEWTYPVHDFFQIDNWGNYLSDAFNCDYKDFGVANKSDLSKYAIIMGSISASVAEFFIKVNFNGKLVGFIEGTPYYLETPQHRPIFIECLNKLDLIYNTIPHGRSLYGIYCDRTKIIDCGHVFPLNRFDEIYQKKPHEGFVVATGGYFNSRHGLASTSVYLASAIADKVIAMTINCYKDEMIQNGEILPNNVVLENTVEQETFWTQILSTIDIMLHLGNEPAQGRLIAECAAASVPCISVENLFQVRCFPELLIDHLYDINTVYYLINKLKTDKEFYTDISAKARDRLIGSNKLEMINMTRGLQQLGFDVKLV